MKKRPAALAVSALAITLSIGLCACSGKDEGADSQTADSSILSRLTSESVTSSEDSEADTQSENTSESAGEAKQNKNPSTANSNTSAAASDTRSAEGSDTLNGNIEKIDTASFVINKTFTETLDDGSLLAYSSSEDKTLITVTFTDSTDFILRSVVNSGINPSDITDTAAAKDNLSLNATVDIIGTMKDSEMSASQIVIYSFQ